jgi:ATP-dependent protease ClpP protease subunit
MNSTWPMRCHIRAETGVTRVDVFDDIGEGGWFSEGLTAKDFAAQLAGIKGPLDVHINSYGGDVGHGIAIGNAIRAHKGLKRTVVDGIAASIASVIAQAGDERIVEPGSMTFVHDAWGGCTGNAADMAKTAADLNKHSDNLAEIYASRAGGGVQHWRDVMQAETWYTAEEAVAAGLADKVGTGQAALPPGLDLAAFTAIPGRIAARLREMPVATHPQDAGARHDPMRGTHSHPHPAYGSQGGDALHSHEHTHDGDANHSHSHAEPDDGAQDAASGEDCPTCKGTGKIDEGHRECPDCHGTGKKAAAKAGQEIELTGFGGAFESELAAWLRKYIGAAAGKPGTHGDHDRFDPDGDGDCDACPEGDTDHDYWSADGEQLKSVPGKPMPAGDSLREAVLAVLRDVGLVPGPDGYFTRPANADVDNSDWDASKAWHNGAQSDDPAAFYAGICAGKKDGDKATQAAWALPYKYTPSSPVNAAGVRNALARLPQTQGLTNEAEAKATLQKAMKKVNPDYEPEDAGDGGPEGKTTPDLSGTDLEEIRAALKGARP